MLIYLFIASISLFLLASSHFSYAYPTLLQNCNEINGSAPGGSFLHMASTNFSPSTTACTISISGGLSTFVPCQQYTLTVTSTSSWGHALSVDNGQITSKPDPIGSETKCGAKSAISTSSSYTFVAPPSGTVQVSAICGDYNTMNAAPKLILTQNISSSALLDCNSTNSTLTPNAQPTGSPTMISKTEEVAGFKSIENLSTPLISIQYRASADKVDFIIQNKNKGWIGFGLASSSGQMVGGRAIIGMDTNSNPGYSSVQIYDLTSKSKSGIKAVGTPADLETDHGVVNASFAITSTESVLKFTIFVNEQDEKFKLVNKDTPPNIIYAIGGSVFDIHTNRGVLSSANFATGENSSTSQPYKTPASVALHIACMIIAYCILFPFGVSIPLYNNKKFNGQKLCGLKGPNWFNTHITIQAIALIVALIGFFSIIYFVSVDGEDHFQGTHHQLGLAVIIGSVLNPIYGALRPHKPDPGHPKTVARSIFEWFHPIFGYTILAAGAANCFLGVKTFAYIAGTPTYVYGGITGTTGMTGTLGVAVAVLVAIFLGIVALGLLLRIFGRCCCQESGDNGKDANSTNNTNDNDQGRPHVGGGMVQI